MEVGFKVRSIVDVVGTPEFLHAFFSTISYHLEPDGWGTRFPELMNHLYKKRLKYSDSPKVLEDLKIIRSELKKFSPDKVIWNIDDLSQSPPWGDKISDDVTDLSNYFVTSMGGDLFEVLIECLEYSIETKEDVTTKGVPAFGGKGITEVGFKVGESVHIVGTPGFLHAWFSIISNNLEPDGWGTRFPELMNHLYEGRLKYSDSRKTLNELDIITSEVKGFNTDEMIRNFRDFGPSPSWVEETSDDITNLWECIFVRSADPDILETLTLCLKVSIQDEEDVTIVRVSPYGQTVTITLQRPSADST